MNEIVFKIEGMTCMHCKMTVEKALKEVPGVTDAWVNLAKKASRGCWFSRTGGYGQSCS